MSRQILNQKPLSGQYREGLDLNRLEFEPQSSSVCCGLPNSCHYFLCSVLCVAFILIEIKSKCFHSQNVIVWQALFLSISQFIGSSLFLFLFQL